MAIAAVDMMTVVEVAQLLKVDKRIIYRLLKSGSIPGFKVNRDWRFNCESLERWIEAGGAHPRETIARRREQGKL